MIRRTNEQIKKTIKMEYAAMHEAACSSLTIARALSTRYNPRLIIEAIQEYNDARLAKGLVFGEKIEHNSNHK